MGSFAGEERDPRGAAERNGAEMLGEGDALVFEVFLDRVHVVDRAKLPVLVIGDDEDEVGLGRSSCLHRSAKQQGSQ